MALRIIKSIKALTAFCARRAACMRSIYFKFAHPMTTSSSPQAQPTIELASVGLAHAIVEFENKLKEGSGQPPNPPFYNSSFMNQYLKAALDNIESGRKAVQEKVKFVIPTELGVFVATWALAYAAFDKFWGTSRGMILLLVAAGLSFLGVAVSRTLNQVMVATYRFYVASTIHAKIVLSAVGLQHHWLVYVDRAVRLLDKDNPQLPASGIRNVWKTKRGRLLHILDYKFKKDTADEEEDKLWSARVMEQWQAQPEGLLHCYQRLLSITAIAHVLFCFVFIATAVVCLKATPASAKTSVAPTAEINTQTMLQASLQSITSNLLVLNADVAKMNTREQAQMMQVVAAMTTNVAELNRRLANFESNVPSGLHRTVSGTSTNQ
jgi:hypothetical protein